MPKRFIQLSLVLLLWMTGSAALAADAPHAAATTPHGAARAATHDPRPVLPASSPLAGSTLILIAGLFLAAATVGPVVRYHAPEEVPETSSHDEHGHGAHDAHGHDVHGAPGRNH